MTENKNTEDGITSHSDIKFEAPNIGLVPIPNLGIGGVQVDFQMELTATETSTDKTAEEGSTNAYENFMYGCYGRGLVNVSDKESSSCENTRSSNQDAKYQVHVSASNQNQAEGLNRLMDIMPSCEAPLQENGEQGGDDIQ